MFSFIGFIFFFILIILILGLSLVGRLLRTIFGLGRRPTDQPDSSHTHSASSSSANGGQNKSSNSPKRKKIFEDNEGEYVEFEEIKED